MSAESSRYDVIVVGAGPAGSLSAYHLAQAGVRVAVLDAKEFPRDKPCGGGVQNRASRHIPFDWSPVIRGALDRVTFSFAFGDHFQRTHTDTLVHTVLRTEFDHFLLTKAVAAGAVFFGGVKTLHFSQPEGGTPSLRTTRGDYTAKFVVGADGANSVVGRALNSRDRFYWQAGLYCEIPRACFQQDRPDPRTIRIDWGTLPSGYGWIFPKNDLVNVGVGGPFSVGRLLRPYARQFLEAEKVLRPESLDDVHFCGHQLPTLTRRTRLSGANVLLVGDAAGLVEPLTGDGISYACHSARIASEVILGRMHGRLPDLASYAARVRDEIGSDILWARRLLSFSVTFPRIFYRLFRSDEAIWRAFCKVLAGDASYERLLGAILGPFRYASLPLHLFTHGYERLKLANACL